jgi:hypothetical protein
MHNVYLLMLMLIMIMVLVMLGPSAPKEVRICRAGAPPACHNWQAVRLPYNFDCFVTGC